MEPVVVEILNGNLKRNDYLFEKIKNNEQISYIIKMMIDESDSDAFVFRRDYLKNDDMFEYIKDVFGKCGIKNKEVVKWGREGKQEAKMIVNGEEGEDCPRIRDFI